MSRIFTWQDRVHRSFKCEVPKIGKIATLLFPSKGIVCAYSKESFSVFDFVTLAWFCLKTFWNPLRSSWSRSFLSRKIPPLVLVIQKMLCWICLNVSETDCYIQILLPNFTEPKCFGQNHTPELVRSYFLAGFLFRTYLVGESRL